MDVKRLDHEGTHGLPVLLAMVIVGAWSSAEWARDVLKRPICCRRSIVEDCEIARRPARYLVTKWRTVQVC